MAEEAAAAGVLLGVHGADLALAALQPRGAALIEVDAASCHRTGGPSRALRELEERLFVLGRGHERAGGADAMRLAARRMELLRRARGGRAACPLLTHHLAGAAAGRRRRYVMDEVKRPGEGFLGTDGWFRELARQRNLLYLNVERCRCVRRLGQEGLNRSTDLRFKLRCHEGDVAVDPQLHIIPLLDAIADERETCEAEA